MAPNRKPFLAMNTSTKKPATEDDCDPESSSVDTALQRMLRQITPLHDDESVTTAAACGRILATDLSSPIDVPGHHNSAMDGYALRSAEIALGIERGLTLAGKSLAGHRFDKSLPAGHCVRITTGAVLPEACDTVVMQEHVVVEGERIRLPEQTRAGNNVRLAGEDIRRGSTVLPAGRRLMPADCGLIASLGIGEVAVIKKPKVAHFGTGDELRCVGEPLAPGEIYDSSRYTLHAALERLGMDALDLGIVRDREQELRDAFHAATAQADALLTTGGVSVGEADFVKQVFGERGRIDFWKIAMKPGRPLAFGELDGTWFFGLPGNPVSSLVTFYQIVQPVLQHLAGASPTPPLLLRATTTTALRKRPGRADYQRGILGSGPDGTLTVASTGPQGSGILSSMSAANCFILLDQDQGDVAAGDTVTVQPFAGLI